MGRKYSQLIIDEAIQLYRTTRLKNVVAITGVHGKTVAAEWLKYRIKNGIPPMRKACNAKLTAEQKIACVKLAVRYVDTGHISSIQNAFIAAGKIMKVNGRVIYNYWLSGRIRGTDMLPQPYQQLGTSTPVGLSGDSIHTASPQSQRWAKQCEDVLLIRPAPRMIKRRKYTSDMIPPGVLKGHKPQV